MAVPGSNRPFPGRGRVGPLWDLFFRFGPPRWSEYVRRNWAGQRLVTAVRAGRSALLFPEGTFGREPGLQRFRTGAFLAAARAGAPVVPIALRGTRSVLRDGRGRKIGLPGWSNRNPVHGHSIDLTIDADIQSVVCERLRAAVDSLDATKAIAVVVDPWTGEVLAAGSEPQPSGPPYRNQAITDQFEPGSTYKMVTMAAALEEGVVKPGDRYDACEGACDFGGFTIHDSHPHGILTLRDAVRYANVATQTVGVYPAARKVEVRDALASAGVQRVVTLGKAVGPGPGLPHDGFYPLHRFVRWVNDED